MDIGKRLSRDTYDRIVQHIHTVARALFHKMSLRVAKQKMEENEKEDFLVIVLRCLEAVHGSTWYLVPLW